MTKDEDWLLNEKYQGEKSAAFFADCERLKAGEPLAYVIGWVPFLGCKIWLDSRPLIPRPETEFWLEKAIEIIKSCLPRVTLGRNYLGLPSVNILDLCAGSGCIGVAVAKAVPSALIDFAEIDTDHLPTIQKNIKENLKQNSTVNCTNVYGSDLFAAVPTDIRYDFILSNPPYVDPALNRVEPSVKDHEPARALYGGRGGLELIEQIIAAAPAHLAPGGQLWLEHEPEQAEAIRALAAQSGLAGDTHTDQYEVKRYSILVLQ